MTEEKLQMEDVIRKKQYVSICSLNLDNSNHKYTDLAAILNVSIPGNSLMNMNVID